ncbi:hypothetical protein [Ligilactobacillus salivarius]|uniref:Uncharacterized protein n=1 Tax=Ligilactobacillus salivarius TaxID=1624 RepID=A0A1V9R7E5_9LACO|nr:hypothetical protein [Ligilactobacillus salivarius]OQQ89077.1 hypothetical protein B6U56_09720 [Ligilactobacillus salivarius]
MISRLRIISIIFLIITSIFDISLFYYNKIIFNFQRQKMKDVDIIAANNYAALKYFLGAVVLIVIAFFILFFLFKAFSESDGVKDFVTLVTLIILILVAIYLIIKLISIPIFIIICKVVAAGGVIVGLFAGATSNN